MPIYCMGVGSCLWVAHNTIDGAGPSLPDTPAGLIPCWWMSLAKQSLITDWRELEEETPSSKKFKDVLYKWTPPNLVGSKVQLTCMQTCPYRMTLCLMYAHVSVQSLLVLSTKQVGETKVPWESKVYFVCFGFVLQWIYAKTEHEVNIFLKNITINKHGTNVKPTMREIYVINLKKNVFNGPKPRYHWDKEQASMGHQTIHAEASKFKGFNIITLD